MILSILLLLGIVVLLLRGLMFFCGPTKKEKAAMIKRVRRSKTATQLYQEETRAAAHFIKLYHDEVSSIRELAAKNMVEVREQNTVNALLEECASFNLCCFHYAAQSEAHCDKASKTLFNKAWVSLATGSMGPGIRVNLSEEAREALYKRLTDRINSLKSFENFYLEALNSGWRESTCGSHFIRVAEILGIDPLGFPAVIIQSAIMNHAASLKTSGVLSAISTETDWGI
jgi:hypothetical protein